MKKVSLEELLLYFFPSNKIILCTTTDGVLVCVLVKKMYTINVNQMYDPYFYPSSHTYKYKHVLCGRKIVVISCNRDNPQLMYLQYIIICTATKMPTDVTTHTNLSRAFSLLIPSVENRHNFKSTTTTVQSINRKARTKKIKLILHIFNFQ